MNNIFAPSYITLRTFSTAVGDTTPPVAGSFVSLVKSPYYDVIIQGSAVGGTVAPTIVIFELWGLYPTAAGTSLVVKLDTVTVEAGNIAVAQIRQLKADTNQAYVTARFLDGTSPTVSAVVYIRQSWIKPVVNPMVDENNYPYQRSLAYDSITGADKTVRMNDLYPAMPEVNVISETSRVSGTTYYWPSDSGIEQGNGYDTLCMQFSVVGAGASVATFTVEGTINGTVWEDVTLSVMDDKAHAYLAGAVATAAGGNLNALWSIYGISWSKTRIKVVISGANTGAVSASFRRSKMGAA